MRAHLFVHKGQLAWSGYNGLGDPSHAYAFVIDVGRDFQITSEGNLYLTGPGPGQFEEFSPAGTVIAARGRMFGFRLIQATEVASRFADKRNQKRQRLGRRGRIAENQRGR